MEATKHGSIRISVETRYGGSAVSESLETAFVPTAETVSAVPTTGLRESLATTEIVLSYGGTEACVAITVLAVLRSAAVVQKGMAATTTR